MPWVEERPPREPREIDVSLEREKTKRTLYRWSFASGLVFLLLLFITVLGLAA